MPGARRALRKKIELTEDVAEDLKKRSDIRPAPSLASKASLVTSKRCAQVWGLVEADQDPDVVRASLVDKADVVTLIEPEAITEAKLAKHVIERAGPGRFLPRKPAVADLDEEKAIAVSLPMISAEIPAPKGHWAPGKSGSACFGSASDAMRLIGASWSDGQIGSSHPQMTGRDVNVIIVDVGCTKRYLKHMLPSLNFGGGFADREPARPDPGMFFDISGKPGGWHGNMIARNILRLAPEARIYDAPLLPSRVTEVESFTEDAEDLFEGIEDAVLNGPRADEPWIIVNAWAVADTIQEYDLGLPANRRFSDGPDHQFNALVRRMSSKFDIVFAAGNFGAFAPDNAAGLYDRGNGRSIKGTNALPEVLTVGSVTTNGEWIGSASHGYGPASFANGEPNRKPDVAAPSWFAENDDPGLMCTGTSAACGVAAGMLAALRTIHRSKTPAAMFDMIRNKAVQPTQDGWNGRTGHGIIRF